MLIVYVIVLVSGLSTPVEMKLKLIPIFRHMHYDLQLTAKVGNSAFKGIINIYYHFDTFFFLFIGG